MTATASPTVRAPDRPRTPAARHVANLQRLAALLRCPSCRGVGGSGELRLIGDAYACRCGARHAIEGGIPRFVPTEFRARDGHNDDLQRKTKNFFGFEWDHFGDWGFLDDARAAHDPNCQGGTVTDRRRAFVSKCRLTQQELRSAIVLDAGCGNGRYSFEAAQRGADLVIGVDLGYGAVTSARANTAALGNVVIVQANLHDLPFRDGVIDGAFSNGVLMHTGDAANAFREVARTVRSGGLFVAHVYQQLNERWEHNDRLIRSFTTGLGIEDNLEFARLMARLARFLSRFDGVLPRANELLRLQVTEHHMFDWYSAPVATHHTYRELADWFTGVGFELLDELPATPERPTGDWACNLKGRKR